MIPAARVRTIMRSGPDCVSVSGEAMYAMTRATVGLTFMQTYTI
jgi:hypothetical protein